MLKQQTKGGFVISMPVNTRQYKTNAGWSSPVARQAHNLKVVSSNLAPATTDSKPSAATEP